MYYIYFILTFFFTFTCTHREYAAEKYAAQRAIKEQQRQAELQEIKARYEAPVQHDDKEARIAKRIAEKRKQTRMKKAAIIGAFDRNIIENIQVKLGHCVFFAMSFGKLYRGCGHSCTDSANRAPQSIIYGYAYIWHDILILEKPHFFLTTSLPFSPIPFLSLLWTRLHHLP